MIQNIKNIDLNKIKNVKFSQDGIEFKYGFLVLKVEKSGSLCFFDASRDKWVKAEEGHQNIYSHLEAPLYSLAG